MYSGGQRLRLERQKLGFTIRDIEAASACIAEKHRNPEYLIPISRLSDFESKGVVPSFYRLYSLAVIFRRDLLELFSWYGVDAKVQVSELGSTMPATSNVRKMRTPPITHISPQSGLAFDDRKPAIPSLASIVKQWGAIPLIFLERLSTRNFTYGYIGTEDLTMFPIIPPGSFVEVDEKRNKVVKGGWRSQYDRPIYFVETRQEYVCCWCTLEADQIVLQSHPLSSVPTRVLPIHEAEVVGQVVGIAMRLGEGVFMNKAA